jgi:DNA topoisomerase-2
MSSTNNNSSNTQRQKRVEKAFSDSNSTKPLQKKSRKSPTKDAEDLSDVSSMKDLTTIQVNKKQDDLEYQKLSHREQVLKRPGMYIGSTRNTQTFNPIFIFDDTTTPRIVLRQAEINEGLMRIFIEVLSNAIDNVWRSLENTNCPTPKFIKVNIHDDHISVWNDGRNISTNVHKAENVPIPELIFGHMLTSSNYDDNKERKTSGLNGVGT